MTKPRSCKLQNYRQYNGQKKKKTMSYKILHRKLRIEQHELYKKAGVYSCMPKWNAAPALLVTPVVILLSETLICKQLMRK